MLSSKMGRQGETRQHDETERVEGGHSGDYGGAEGKDQSTHFSTTKGNSINF